MRFEAYYSFLQTLLSYLVSFFNLDVCIWRAPLDQYCNHIPPVQATHPILPMAPFESLPDIHASFCIPLELIPIVCPTVILQVMSRYPSCPMHCTFVPSGTISEKARLLREIRNEQRGIFLLVRRSEGDNVWRVDRKSRYCVPLILEVIYR